MTHTPQNLVILTGAGISAESGISTFRDAGGLWEGHHIEDVASPRGFARDPALVHHFYNLRRAQLACVAPNAAHLALAALERAWRAARRGQFLLITQNVDDLHERAGSQRLVHMHGELRKLRCTACDTILDWPGPATPQTPCPACARPGGTLRPDIVWFGEVPYQMETCLRALLAADIFCAIGTSGLVYPAAGFAQTALENGRACRLFEINPKPTGTDLFDDVIAEPASTGVAEFVRRLQPA
ncbi:NAD-dependent deacylase [Acidocella sp.]|uniref:NAD-dependent deacylase n=1 Tax=Acidocella sp. TaxID=50710 RepID=UPI0026249CC7|nr:NAD-dependent deacylase [Acidocella sp.]